MSLKNGSFIQFTPCTNYLDYRIISICWSQPSRDLDLPTWIHTWIWKNDIAPNNHLIYHQIYSRQIHQNMYFLEIFGKSQRFFFWWKKDLEIGNRNWTKTDTRIGRVDLNWNSALVLAWENRFYKTLFFVCFTVPTTKSLR